MASRSESAQAEDAFEMCEQHFDFLSSPLGGLFKLGRGTLPRKISDDLTFFTINAAGRRVRAAFLFRRAVLAIKLQASILTTVGLGLVPLGVRIVSPGLTKLFTFRANVPVIVFALSEVRTRLGAVFRDCLRGL